MHDAWKQYVMQHKVNEISDVTDMANSYTYQN